MAWRRRNGRAGACASKWVGWLFTVIPAILLLVGLGFLAEAIVFVSDAEKARGRVVDIRANHSDDGVSYTPTIRYRRDDGQTFEAETHMASSGYDYDIGARVDILYSHDEPDEVRIDSVFSLYGPGAIFAAVAMVFLFIGKLFRRTTAKAAAQTRQPPATSRPGKSGTTDPSQPGHVHEPKPKQPPTIRRMR